jgi:hypothetical protein
MTRPSNALLVELARIAETEPGLRGLTRPSSEDYPTGPPTVLCPGSYPLFLVEIPIPGRPGRLWASRLPGRPPSATHWQIAALRAFGINRVVCLVPPEPLANLHGADRYLAEAGAEFGSAFHILDVEDHMVPAKDEEFDSCARTVDAALSAGERILVHCVGGCGRTGLFACCILIRAGLAAREAILHFRRHRRCGPETVEQVAYTYRYARRIRADRPLLPVVRVAPAHGSAGGWAVLAHGGLATIYAGRAWFAGGKVRRVAIKVPHAPLSDTQAADLSRCIEDLRRAGVSLPKLFVHRLPDGRWAQVSPLFGSTRRGSKLAQPALFYRDLDLGEKELALTELTHVANAGYLPSVDLFVMFRPPLRGLLPIDFDLVCDEPDVKRRAAQLARALVQMGSGPAERDRLLEVALGAASTQTAEALGSLLAPDGPFRRLWRL